MNDLNALFQVAIFGILFSSIVLGTITSAVGKLPVMTGILLSVSLALLSICTACLAAFIVLNKS